MAIEKYYFVNGKKYTKEQMVTKGISQCFLQSYEDEYETQCYDCPYYDRELSVSECQKQLQEDTLNLLKKQHEMIKTLSVFARADGIDVDSLFDNK